VTHSNVPVARSEVPTPSELAQRQQEAARAFNAMTPEQHLRAALEALGNRTNGDVGTVEARQHLAEVPGDAGTLSRQAAQVLREIETREAIARARWEYRDHTDEMRGAATHVACLPSSEPLNFSFPYQGGQTAHICFRQSPQHGFDAWLDVDRGQFLCHFGGCSVRVKFDDGPVQTFRAVRSEGGDPTMIFLNGGQRFLAATRTAHRILVEADFYRDGTYQIHFNDAGGLVWPRSGSRAE